MQITVTTVRTLIVMISLAALGACGNEDRSAARVVATVNGGAITLDRLQSAAGPSPTGAVKSDQSRTIAAQVLERLIDQELLVQKAYELKLDQEQAISMALDDSRRQVLARAYVDRLVLAAGPAGAEEVRAFYHANPLLFERRSIYTVAELTVIIPVEKTALLRERVAASRSIEDIAAWLRQQQISFTSGSGSKPAERLPTDFLPRLAEMTDGQIELFQSRGGVWVVQLLRRQEAPLDEAQAAPVIERFLANRKRAETVASEISRLRRNARIQYAGEFQRAQAATAAPSTGDAGQQVPTARASTQRELPGL